VQGAFSRGWERNMDTNNYEIVLTDIANEELEEIYKYISENLLEVSIANKLMEKIEQSFLRLEQNPYSCVEVHIKPHNEVYRKLVIDNYIALYEVEENYKQVVIYRVLYGGMDYLNIIWELTVEEYQFKFGILFSLVKITLN